MRFSPSVFIPEILFIQDIEFPEDLNIRVEALESFEKHFDYQKQESWDTGDFGDQLDDTVHSELGLIVEIVVGEENLCDSVFEAAFG